jgi:hypothetical protein
MCCSELVLFICVIKMQLDLYCFLDNLPVYLDFLARILVSLNRIQWPKLMLCSDIREFLNDKDGYKIVYIGQTSHFLRPGITASS